MLPYALLVLAAVVLRLPYLHEVLDRDQALYAAIGRNLDLNTLPYRDLFDHKQPLVHFAYWAIDLVGGHRLTPIRLAAALVPGATAALMLAALRRVIGTPRALAAAVLFTVLSATIATQGMDLNTEHLQVLPATAAVLAALLGRVRLAGVMLGLTVLAKASGAPVLVPVLVALGAQDRRAYARFLVAAAAPVVLVVAFFVIAGAGSDFLYANLTYNRLYISSQTAQFGRQLFPPGAEVKLLLLLGLGAAGVRLAACRGRDRTAWVALTWLVATWLGAWIGGAGYPHYFAPCVPAAALCLAVGLDRARVAWAAPAALALAVLLLAFGAQITRVIGKGPNEIALLVYGPQAQRWIDSDAVADAVAAEARPGDTLFVAASEPHAYWRTGVTPATPYLFDAPVSVDPARVVPRLRRDLCRRRPRFVVIYTGVVPDYAKPCLSDGYAPLLDRGTAAAYVESPR